MNPNIAFLIGVAPDSNGRTLQQYLEFDDNDWEFQHDIIQMAFPTRTQSKFHPDQPFLPADFKPVDPSNDNPVDLSNDEFQRCRAAISLLLHGYLKSLGVEFLINRDLVHLECRFQYPHWAASSDHNTLRLTRILECLGIFGMVRTQTALHDYLVYKIAPGNSDRISTKTVAFWVAAKENKLHLLR